MSWNFFEIDQSMVDTARDPKILPISRIARRISSPCSATLADFSPGSLPHLELSGVVVGIAEADDLKSWVQSDDSNCDSEYIFPTWVMVCAREEADVG